MVEVTEKDQAVEEDGDPDDFTALESIKDDLDEGMFFMNLIVFILNSCSNQINCIFHFRMIH